MEYIFKTLEKLFLFFIKLKDNKKCIDRIEILIQPGTEPDKRTIHLRGTSELPDAWQQLFQEK